MARISLTGFHRHPGKGSAIFMSPTTFDNYKYLQLACKNNFQINFSKLNKMRKNSVNIYYMLKRKSC